MSHATHVLPGHPVIPGASAARKNVWRVVSRVVEPKLLLASAASMVLGGAAAARDGPMAWGWLGVTIAGVLLLEAAKNRVGDLPGSVQGKVLAAALYALGAACAVAIIGWRDGRVLWLGLAGLALGYAHRARRPRLSHPALGATAIALAYGPLVASGTYLVQRGAVPVQVALASLPLGLLTVALLWIDDVRDGDAAGGAAPRTMAARIGGKRTSQAFAAVVGGAYVALAALPLLGVTVGVWLGLAGAPHAFLAAQRFAVAHDDDARMAPARAWTLVSLLLMAAGAALGLLVGPR